MDEGDKLVAIIDRLYGPKPKPFDWSNMLSSNNLKTKAQFDALLRMTRRIMFFAFVCGFAVGMIVGHTWL